MEEHQQTPVETAEEARPIDPPVEAESPEGAAAPAPEPSEPLAAEVEIAPAEPEALEPGPGPDPAPEAEAATAEAVPPVENPTEAAPAEAVPPVENPTEAAPAEADAPAVDEARPTDPPPEAEAPARPEMPPIDTETPRVGPKIVGMAEDKPPPIAVIKRLQDPRRPRRKRPNAAEKHRRAFFARLNELRGSRPAPAKQEAPPVEEALAEQPAASP